MDIKCYLAMTASELANTSQPSTNTAYMACHFSGSNAGLTNLPETLPPQSMVIIDDLIPPDGHSPELITQQLKNLSASCILLDLQRPDIQENHNIAAALVKHFPGQVGVSSLYSENLDCPVFLPPPPLHMPLKKYLQKWKHRDIWLEIEEETAQITVTEKGSTYQTISDNSLTDPIFDDEALCCQYHIALHEDNVCFTLRRNKENLLQLIHQAQEHGVCCAVGPYALLHPFP